MTRRFSTRRSARGRQARVATPLFSVGGLASGLDTNSMITQLMGVERAPVTALETRRAGYQARANAWQSIRTRLSSLHTSIDTVRNAADFDTFSKVTSSDPDAVSVVLGSSGTTGATSASFRVEALAARHQLAATGTFSGLDSLVDAGTLTLTAGSVAHTITTTGTTTLGDLLNEVNALGAGVKANAVAVGSTSYRLLISADGTGADAAFTASGTQANLGAFEIVEQGANSRIVIGGGVGAITLERATNTIDDLIAGATVTLKDTTASAVSVEVTRDVDAAVDAVKSLVGEINKTVGVIAELTKYDAATKKAGTLQGERSAWQMVADLRTQVSALASGGVGAASATSIGITIARDGMFTVDATKLRSAFEADYPGTASVLGRSGSSTDSRLQFVRASDATVAGAYPVVVSAAAARAGVTGSAYTPPASDDAFTITQGSMTANVVVTGGSDLATALAQINTALSAAGLTTLKATDDGGAIRLQESRYGSSILFTVAGGSTAGTGLAGTFAGTNVAGTIGGVAATGTGQALTATTGPAKGLQVKVTATQAAIVAAGGWLPLGSPAYQEGIAGRLSRYLATAEGLTGIVSTSSNRWASQIKLVNEQIATYELRLDQREITLRRQLTAMETAMSTLSQQGSWMTQQLASQ